jgi:DNA-binding NarL/FixJ family response regulator
MSNLRVLLADDHAVVRAGLKALLQAEPGLDLVGEAGEGETAVCEAVRLRPDVVVMDVSMPGLNGTEATQRLKQQAPEIRVVALTAHEDTSYAKQLLEVGASGFVLKRAAAHVLIDAIRTVADGKIYIDPAVGARMVQGYLKNVNSGHKTDLSERENSVLRLIAQGYSNKEVAAKLELSVKTVETYKARSMEKLKLDSRVDIIKYAMLQGWLQEL